ncbi:MAG: hypothetical protein RMK18_00265 [Armatimonadota bacterium]|nr:hypothetical protein [Armatimonadota bacterium]MCX7776493.1 hypothetical protein [Armatimonadota bacterium]MDW8024290.1 hypothetical protein [Armatimonadota bacterium]
MGWSAIIEGVGGDQRHKDSVVAASISIAFEAGLKVLGVTQLDLGAAIKPLISCASVSIYGGLSSAHKNSVNCVTT